MDAIRTESSYQLNSLLKDARSAAMSYKEFRALMKDLSDLAETSGAEQKESLIDYTKMNHRRLKRWDKTYRPSNAAKTQLANLNKKIEWLVLTESWCGDAAPSLPVMNKFTEMTPNLKLGILLRDENLELMEQFKTEGSLSIPKLIAIDHSSGEVMGEWGPRPSKATAMAREFKQEYGSLTAEFKEDLQRWYNADKGRNIEEDLMNILTLKYVGNSTDL